jgi:hypothetical protein
MRVTLFLLIARLAFSTAFTATTFTALATFILIVLISHDIAPIWIDKTMFCSLAAYNSHYTPENFMKRESNDKTLFVALTQKIASNNR